jgi:hypothetical protein
MPHAARQGMCSTFEPVCMAWLTPWAMPPNFRFDQRHVRGLSVRCRRLGVIGFFGGGLAQHGEDVVDLLVDAGRLLYYEESAEL